MLWDESTKKILKEVVKIEDGLLIFSITKPIDSLFIEDDSIIVVKLFEEDGLIMLIDILLVVEFTKLTWHLVWVVVVYP